MCCTAEEKKKFLSTSSSPPSIPSLHPDSENVTLPHVAPPSHWLDSVTNFYPLSFCIYWSISFIFALQAYYTAFARYISTALTKTPRRLDSLKSPAHVALAGTLNDALHISRLAVLLERCGTAELSVAHESSAEIEKSCAQAGVKRLRIRVIPQSSPSTPRAMVVKAARTISNACQTSSRDEIIARLDEWHRNNHLASEPDVVVLIGTQRNAFPPFSCWQLRLSQFRFISTPLHALSHRQFLTAVCSATKVAKRFGR